MRERRHNTTIKRIVAQVRQSWPEVWIILRGDSGFSRDEMMTWCESQEKIDYLFGQAKNERLLKLLKIGAQVQVTVRRVVVRLASSYPFQELFIRIYRRLQGLEELRC